MHKNLLIVNNYIEFFLKEICKKSLKSIYYKSNVQNEYH